VDFLFDWGAAPDPAPALHSPFLFAANSSSLRRRWRSKRGGQRTVKKEQKNETPRAPIFCHASRRLSSNTVSSHKQEQQQHQRGGKAVAATPPTAPAHHSFDVPAATSEGRAAAATPPTAPAAAQTRRKVSCSNTREEEEQPQQHHQPHQLIISFGLCFFFSHITFAKQGRRKSRKPGRESDRRRGKEKTGKPTPIQDRRKRLETDERRQRLHLQVCSLQLLCAFVFFVFALFK